MTRLIRRAAAAAAPVACLLIIPSTAVAQEYGPEWDPGYGYNGPEWQPTNPDQDPNFRFAASEQVLFQCNRDRRTTSSARRKFVQRVGRGKPRIKVGAFDLLGQFDSTAAKFRWNVKPRR